MMADMGNQKKFRRVEVGDIVGGGAWLTSSRSGGGNCIEIKCVQGAVLVRDSKDPTGGCLVFNAMAWNGFFW